MVSWWDKFHTTTTLSFLIQHHSREKFSRSNIGRVILDGPYGRDLNLKNYEIILLFGKGIGIASVFSYALDLVELRTHEKQEYRRSVFTRKVDLIWVLEDNNQFTWASQWIEELAKKDSQKVSCPLKSI
jgi:NAD(P)H-flavin reductase